jgi:hypothetical protein
MKSTSVINQLLKVSFFSAQFIWDHANVLRFQQAWNDGNIIKKINQLTNIDSFNGRQDIDKAILSINEIYVTVASKSLKTKKILRNRIKRKKTCNKWFDKTLLAMKNKVIKNSRQLQKHPNDPLVRQNLFTSLKTYNRTRKRKARNSKANLIHKLDELRTSNPQSY